MSTLRAENLTRRFGELEAVGEVSFELAPGARHALIGPNGAGKTTLVNLLTGALPAKDTECAGTGIPAPVDPPALQARAAQPVGNPLLRGERYTEIARSALR